MEEVLGLVQEPGGRALACHGGQGHGVRGGLGQRGAEGWDHLAGLRMAQIKAGMRAPDWSTMDRLAQLRKGLARMEAVGGRVTLVRKPVKWVHMRAMHSVWRGKGERGKMLWAAACMCFFGCLRAGEALAPESGEFDKKAHMTWGDLQLEKAKSPVWIGVRIKESKTDRLRVGASVTLHRTDRDICPVRAVLEFMVCRGSGPGPFFTGGGGGSLTRRDFVVEVRKALVERGIPESGISGHTVSASGQLWLLLREGPQRKK